MTPLARPYPDIVRDLLTVLTGGTAREVIEIGATVPDSVPLQTQPIRRVSFVEGTIVLGEDRVPYRFTEREFELVGSDRNPDELIAIRFRPKARRPAPNSELIVNYYPVHLARTPITDVNVGSVARTLLETTAREMAVQYAQLQQVYDSAFVETAEAASLDKVVALVDVRRLRAGHPVGRVRFARRPGSPGEITVPISTIVTDGKKARYLTTSEGKLQPSQGSVDIPVQGESPLTPTVDARALTVLERAIAGIDAVTNEAPTFRAANDETDGELRTRARRAIHATGRGTLDALRFGLESFPFVRAVTATEYPDPLVPTPGIVRLDVALSEDNAINRLAVDNRIEDLRPAGIYVQRGWAAAIQVGLLVDLHLTAALPDAELASLKADISNRLIGEVRALPPGGTLRRNRLVAAAMTDTRLADVAITIVADGAPVATDALTVPPDKTAVPSETPVTFGTVSQDGTAAGPGQVAISAELSVQPLGGDAAALEPQLRTRLTNFLAALPAGASLGFDAVANAVRDDTLFALDRPNTVLTIDMGAGGFTELRDGDPDLALPPGAQPVLGTLTVQAAS